MNWPKKLCLSLHLYPFLKYDKYHTLMNCSIKFGLSLHIYPFVLVRAANALARLCECAVSSEPLVLEYAIMNWRIHVSTIARSLGDKQPM